MCKHVFIPLYEDDVLLGQIFYGWKCKNCQKMKYAPPGPLELGTYK